MKLECVTCKKERLIRADAEEVVGAWYLRTQR